MAQEDIEVSEDPKEEIGRLMAIIRSQEGTLQLLERDKAVAIDEAGKTANLPGGETVLSWCAELLAKFDAMLKLLEEVHLCVRNVPKLQQERDEARRDPLATALEMHDRLKEILEPDEMKIWAAVREGGSQKKGLELLLRNKVRLARPFTSLPTMSRRVAALNEKRSIGLTTLNAPRR